MRSFLITLQHPFRKFKEFGGERVRRQWLMCYVMLCVFYFDMAGR